MFEAAGYLASSLVFAAFCMKGMVHLRLAAASAMGAFGLALSLLVLAMPEIAG
jgi:hypothetical protein